MPLLRTKQAILEVFDGSDNTAPLIGRYTGVQSDFSQFSSGNNLFISFTSSDQDEIGFRAHYSCKFSWYLSIVN